MEPARVLVVDDDEAIRRLCVEVLEKLGFRALTARSAADGLARLTEGHVDAVLTDVQMPGMSGLELLKRVKQEYPDVEVLVMTGYGSIPQAVEAVKLGAYDYITKPFPLEDLESFLERLQEKRRWSAAAGDPQDKVGDSGLPPLVGTSPAIRRVYDVILRVASRRHPVLILGESGTGKELAARAIHDYGPWSGRPFVPVDCGSLTPTLIESELFGHVRGAFTGANQARTGLLIEAAGGTLFMDEIGELPAELQSKLLRVLQEKEVRPLGSNERKPLEARIVAATNVNVEEAVESGRLRKDLYFRLNVVTIRMPPLRDRKSDIPALIDCFLRRHRMEAEARSFAPEVMERLMAYDWPGNVRELENCVQRALSLGSGGRIEVNDLPSAVIYRTESAVGSRKDAATLEELERRAIVEALEAARGDRQRAAKLLGIGKTTIYRKLKEYGLEGTPARPA